VAPIHETLLSCPAEVPGIHEFPGAGKIVDGPDKPGHDGFDFCLKPIKDVAQLA
jgi:hypothetical protein